MADDAHSNSFFDDEEDIASPQRAAHDPAAKPAGKGRGGVARRGQAPATKPATKTTAGAQAGAKVGGARKEEDTRKLAQILGAQAGAKVGGARKPAGQGGAKVRRPSFAIVVAIAVVAIILGFALGYFVALAQVSSEIAALYAGDTSGTSLVGASAGVDVNSEADLPSGHPDLSGTINADGSINESALADVMASLSSSGDAA